MFALLTNTWFKYFAGTAFILALLYVASLRTQVLKLENDLLAAEQDLAKGQREKLQLELVLKEQNGKMRELEQLGKASKAKTQTLLARLNNESSERVMLVERLKVSEARTCEEGILLIDEALGL